MTDPHDHSHHTHPAGSDHHVPSSALLMELRDHLPFSVSSVVLGLILAGTICILCAGLSNGVQPEHEHASTSTLPHETPPANHEANEHTEGAHAEDAHSERAHADNTITVPVPAGTTEGHVHGTAAGHTHGEGHVHSPAQFFFHLFHPAHMFFSAAATTAMFFRYERRLLKAIIIGMIGAIGVCGVSDIVMPHVSLLILGVRPPWHICIIEHPMLVLPFAVIGVAVGLGASLGVMRSTLFSHSLHVFASTMASIFYMVGPLGMLAWIDELGMVFLFVALAVMLPCCVSDIVFPVLMTSAGRLRYDSEGHRCCN